MVGDTIDITYINDCTDGNNERMTRELTEILREQAKLYENGEEHTGTGVLDAPGWRFFECQQELVKKVKHLNEFDSDSETARKAMMVGLNMLAADYVDEAEAQELKNQMEGLAGGEQ